MATMKDVAQLAQVSTCTVSRVLSNTGYISDQTRKKVHEAVDQLDYQINSVAADLKHGVSNTIGLILPDITNYYYMELAAQIEQYAISKGFLIYLCNSNGSKKREKKFTNALLTRNIRGLIVIPCSSEIDHFIRLKNKKIPIVFINRFFESYKELCIVENNVQAARDIVAHLVSLKKNRIAGVFPNFENMIYQERYRGMVLELAKNNLAIEDSLMILQAEKTDLSDRLEQMFTQHPLPDAVFAANDMLAFEIYQVLYKLNLQIPEDVAVVGFDDTQMAQKIYPTLTSYRMPIDIIAKLSLDSVLQGFIDINQKPILGSLVVRMSTEGKHVQA